MTQMPADDAETGRTRPAFDPRLVTTGTPLIYPELSYRIVGCAMKVHSALGPSLPERLYQRAMMIELAAAGLAVERERPFAVAYAGQPIGTLRVDHLVEERVVLELKATTALTPVDEQQALAYLRITGVRLALLINFGREKLEHKRIVN